ncbi:deaminase [Glaciihabitans arcticus]|uniref:Deaminase n=1 Tax=Glaciihabitans arcticus TaxID=2668039 RepID=A0A4Q9GTQ6_9MICO|nr:dihydrofolate reductase family protein [Glaciihabitans arcticus]TBN57564.1 deaminase [Glaciihabitans arcticus]
MRTLIAVENVSLDGVMQSPGRPDEDTRDGFSRGGWAAELLMKDQEAAMAAMSGQGNVTGMVFGRRTYDDLVGFWLSNPNPNPFTEILRNTPKHVATSNPELPHPNSFALEGDPVAAVTALTASDEGELVILGSGMLVRTLADAGLIDRYVLTILPVVLGSGTRLFGETYAPMNVLSSFTSPTGIVVATYEVTR